MYLNIEFTIPIHSKEWELLFLEQGSQEDQSEKTFSNQRGKYRHSSTTRDIVQEIHMEEQAPNLINNSNLFTNNK